jgi:hypothetical protein
MASQEGGVRVSLSGHFSTTENWDWTTESTVTRILGLCSGLEATDATLNNVIGRRASVRDQEELI